MNFLHLEYFVITIRLGSVQNAAQHLYLSTQSISKTIRALEKEFQVNLVVKTKGAVSLTPAGKVLYSKAEKLIAGYETITSMKQTLRETQSTETSCKQNPILIHQKDADTAQSHSAYADQEAPLHHRARTTRPQQS